MNSATQPSLRVATFNCEWRKSSSADAALIRERLSACGPDVVCLTEGYADFFDGEGHVIESEPDGRSEGRRKVLLWSRHPWLEVDRVGSRDLPPGRFIRARTLTPIGNVTFVGVCVPYRFAEVRFGKPKRASWELHLRYLSALEPLLTGAREPLVMSGDINQRVPPKYQPQHVTDALRAAVLEHLDLATDGMIEPLGKQAIDHIFHTRDLKPARRSALSNIAPDGRRISDHFGIEAEFNRAALC